MKIRMLSKKDNLANFLFNAIVLCGIVVGLALVAGVAFGGVRLLIKRLFPDSVFEPSELWNSSLCTWKTRPRRCLESGKVTQSNVVSVERRNFARF